MRGRRRKSCRRLLRRNARKRSRPARPGPRAPAGRKRPTRTRRRPGTGTRRRSRSLVLHLLVVRLPRTTCKCPTRVLTSRWISVPSCYGRGLRGKQQRRRRLGQQLPSTSRLQDGRTRRTILAEAASHRRQWRREASSAVSSDTGIVRSVFVALLECAPGMPDFLGTVLRARGLLVAIAIRSPTAPSCMAEVDCTLVTRVPARAGWVCADFSSTFTFARCGRRTFTRLWTPLRNLGSRMRNGLFLVRVSAILYPWAEDRFDVFAREQKNEREICAVSSSLHVLNSVHCIVESVLVCLATEQDERSSASGAKS